MGIIQHDAVIVTGVDVGIKGDPRANPVARLHALAVDLFPHLDISPILKSHVNGYTSFMIPPDGSKEGWDCSDDYDELRERFFDRARKEWCDVVLVSYGELHYTLTPID